MDSLSHHLSPPFTGCSPVASQAVRPSSAFSKYLAGCIVACSPTSTSGSRASRSRLVDSLPSWRTGLVVSVNLKRTFSPRPVNLLCHAALVMSGTSLWFLVRCLYASGRRPGFPPAGCVDHARAPLEARVAFHGHSSASRPPARQVAAASLSPLSSLCGLHAW